MRFDHVLLDQLLGCLLDVHAEERAHRVTAVDDLVAVSTDLLESVLSEQRRERVRETGIRTALPQDLLDAGDDAVPWVVR